MLELLACLPVLTRAIDEWTVLAPPALCSRSAEVVQPPLLLSGSHLELVRTDARSESEARAPALPFTTFLQIVDEDARLHGTRLELQRQAGGALVRGEAAALERVRAIQAAFDAAGRALDIDLDVQLVPAKPGARDPSLAFHRRVRSGDLVFFGRRDARPYVAGFDVEVAADSGTSEPVIGRASTGRGLHLLCCRVAGGERVFVWGLLDLADLAEMSDFDPKTPDLGILQQPRILSAQVVFAGVIDAAGALKVEIQGTPLSTPDWKLEVRATTTSDGTLDAAAGSAGADAGFAVIDMALLATDVPQIMGCEPGTLLRNSRSRAVESATSPIPPSAVAALVETARGAGGRGARAALYWSEKVLLVPRSDPAALREARAYVRSAESARTAGGRVELALGSARASLPTCAGVPARFTSGSERPLLVEYRLELAPQIWMPAPIVELAFDGLCFDVTPDGRGAEVAAWIASSGPVTELERENVPVGRLQLAMRSLHSGALRVEAGAGARLELSGDDTAVATARFEPR